MPSSMAISYYFLFLLFPSVLRLFLDDCSDRKVEAYGFKEMTQNFQSQSHVVSLSSLMPAQVCSTPAQGSDILSRGELQVTHKHGPCSPLKEANKKIPSLTQILMDDRSRIKFIHSKISNQDLVTNFASKIPANSGYSLGTENFVVRIGLGTPMQNLTLILDTGSDLTWVQCQPCVANCYLQQDPLFNPSASSTYSNITCNSHACAQLQQSTGNSRSCNTTCIYQIAYGDGSSYSEGYFATDTLTLSDLSSSDNVFPKFEFGCGENNQGQFGSADGLLGLGRNQVSMVSQTAQKYRKLFSYCLPSTRSSTGFLAFGSQVGDHDHHSSSSSSAPQYTPLLIDSNIPSFYFITMMGISVGGKNLSIPQSVFTTSGTIIDSGTVITRLPPAAYSALRSAFRQAMSEYPVYSIEYTYVMLDTCYNLNGYDTITIPTIVLHFAGGVNLSIDQSGILIQANKTHYCLAFAGNNAGNDLGILGNLQQRGIEVIYNVTGGKLGFGTSACSTETAVSTPPPMTAPAPAPAPHPMETQALCTSINIILPQQLI
ncbi:aspartyl protease family protein At5g10770-like [Macadamia integrifolia]|uniref:aspartyl protease family protein At5g10770-like n=1 Tax=Macadamia integrifolia TaxID=60698 RepID=UPI001C4EC0AC|nr:aspartyl protease family protein At5g10770-like [Macadamia integrifolia]